MAPRKKAAPEGPPSTATEAASAILSDTRVLWFPVRHFSPACAWHLRAMLRAHRPAAVLVEGPADAEALIPHLVDPDTKPPFTLFSSLTDKDNRFGQNGTLSAAEDIAVRYRGWWPFTAHAPEYVALTEGHALGAELAFCDLPLSETIPYKHLRERETSCAVDDAHLARSAYFEALRTRQRRRSFDEFWNATFEAAGHAAEPDAFRRAVLTFAWCVRWSTLGPDETPATAPPDPTLVADGTLAREAFMRQRIDEALKAHKGAPIAVVTGAFHTVALPWTVPAKLKLRRDKQLETLLTAHSYEALASLYQLNRLPGYAHAVWEAMTEGEGRPYDAAALGLITETMRRLRDRREPASTADAVAAWRSAQDLATLRGNREVTREDLLDAVQMTLVKGDLRVHGGAVERVAAEVMVGHLRGQVTAAAGAVSLLRDYYAQCKAHRIDVTGATKTVRCDLGRTAEHRHKSAFLHQCALLEVPMFTGIAEGSANPAYPGGFYKGPDLATGENLHLLGETWGVRWSERVDERLLDLSDRGATVAAAASERVRVSLAQEVGNAEASTRLLLRAAQMGLTDLFDDALTAVEEAIADDTLFEHLTAALRDFVMLYAYRDTLPTRGHARVLGTIEALFARCASTLPAVVYAQGDLAPRVLDGMQTLVRVALSFDAARLDRALLVARLQEMVALPDGNPTLRGAGYGVLYSLGATRERVVAEALDAYLQGDDEEALRAGPFLDGLFLSARNIFLGSTRLLRVVNAVLGRLDWARFKRILPDLRRAFTQFIPTEIDQIGQRVSETVGLDAPPPRDLPVPPALAALAAESDRDVAAVLDAWG